MRIRKVELNGFRGFSVPTVIEFGPAFSVICGRNGSGKSSVFDAIEFALSGHLERFGDESENRETIENYLWWRKTPGKRDRFVRVTFETEEGREIVVSRDDRNRFAGLRTSDFFREDIAPDQPLAQLLRTSIIRDETITRYSTDLSETGKSDFVNKALGLHALSRYIRNADALLERAQLRVKAKTTVYEAISSSITQLNSQMAELRASASRVNEPTDLDTLKSNLGSLVEWSSEGIIGGITSIRRALSNQRTLVAAAERVLSRLSSITAQKETLKSVVYEERRSHLRSRIDHDSTAAENIQRQLNEVQAALQSFQKDAPTQTSLAILQEHGSQLGLLGGRCPLCGSSLSEGEFRAHLQQIQAQLDSQNDKLRQLVNHEAVLRQQLLNLQRAITANTRELATLNETPLALDEQEKELKAQARDLGVELDLDRLRTFIYEAKEAESKLQTALSNVETSEALERLAALERDRQGSLETQKSTEGELREYERTERLINDSLRVLRRLDGDIIRDRLASISPVFLELYSRLRPHKEFLTIKYQVRGDVRHFLSLLVEADINPRFTFSAGQKRVLGLAFLLSIYLSRTWSTLKTVILDDPVQHIDDYRALHVVEVLSAINASGNQVICAVEDPDLADVLCRRLGDSTREPGTRIDMNCAANLGATVSSSTLVGRLPARVLLSA